MTALEQALLFGLVANIVIWGYVLYKSYDRPLLPAVVRRTLRSAAGAFLIVNVLGAVFILAPDQRRLLEMVGVVPVSFMTLSGIFVILYWINPFKNGS